MSFIEADFGLGKCSLRWIDGSQNIADVLTKLNVDRTYLFRVLREASWSVVQDPAAKAVKKKKGDVQRRARRLRLVVRTAACCSAPVAHKRCAG